MDGGVQPATQAGGLRLHQTKHQLRGDRSIGRRATQLQDAGSGVGGVLIRRHHHAMAPGHLDILQTCPVAGVNLGAGV